MIELAKEQIQINVHLKGYLESQEADLRCQKTHKPDSTGYQNNDI